jgi:hypothetical protein
MSIASFLKKIRKQKAILWDNPVNDGMGGFSFDAPVEMSVRWDDSTEEYTSPEGTQKVSSSIVIMDRVCKIGSYLQLGSITPTTPVNPIGLSDAYSVQQLKNIRDIKNKTSFIQAFL